MAVDKAVTSTTAATRNSFRRTIMFDSSACLRTVLSSTHGRSLTAITRDRRHRCISSAVDNDCCSLTANALVCARKTLKRSLVQHIGGQGAVDSRTLVWKAHKLHC
jgi:hypothetical protein